MKIALISCFETYQNRIDDMEKYYSTNGNDVTIIKSNYLHFKKEKINNDNKMGNVVLIDVPEYKKNISIKRAISHSVFSKKVLSILQKENFDLVHVLVPPNSLCKRIAKLNKNTKIIFDVIDFWPETMPMEKLSRSFIYKKWKELRNSFICKSDYILTECNLFEEELLSTIKISKIKTVYFTREKKIDNIEYVCSEETIELVYLGSINNIIDIRLIVNILREIKRKKNVIFHIIGAGESKGNLLNLLKENNITYVDHGLVYDDLEKNAIFKKCSFAFNIMKPDVFVGLTMKSLDYFQFSIPIVNNIKFDTEELVSSYKCGINIKDYEDYSLLADEIIKKSDRQINLKLRKNVENLFEEQFQYNNLEKKMNLMMEEL
ncbi:hypothetical protein P7H70_05730 [Vagococcus carniphilus]|uniref:Uncharacterized protein n=1 Tax=Vagococcus carniphilus TaxID=218144 RepID=A0AAW8U3A4_9ENTE|nr:hypothetical protein [Vagococcus carniphilus]MDT2833549.1 hypothetical protein [Vagococcus carniphilus]